MFNTQLANAESDIRATTDLFLKYMSPTSTALEELVGDFADRLKSDVTFGIECLASKDDKIRTGAILSLTTDSEMSRKIPSDVLQDLVLSDSCPVVRGFAVLALVDRLHEVGDYELRKTLEAIQLNQTMRVHDPAVRELVNDASDLLALISETKKEVEVHRDNQLRGLAGSSYDEIVQSRDAAIKLLRSEAWNERFAAVTILVEHWGLDEELVRECELICASDPNGEVRGVAISAISRFYADSHNERIARWLVDIVKDEMQSSDLRLLAYLGFLKVISRHDVVKSLANSAPDIIFSRDVDWHLVERFA